MRRTYPGTLRRRLLIFDLKRLKQFYRLGLFPKRLQKKLRPPPFCRILRPAFPNSKLFLCFQVHTQAPLSNAFPLRQKGRVRYCKLQARLKCCKKMEFRDFQSTPKAQALLEMPPLNPPSGCKAAETSQAKTSRSKP